MKKRIVVEIDIPETNDLCWSEDVSGFQIYHETLKCYAMAWAIEALSMALNKDNLDEVSKKQYIEYVKMKNNIVNKSKMVAYIDENDNYIEWNPDKYGFQPPRKINGKA